MPYLKTLTPTNSYLLSNKDRKKYKLPPSIYKIYKTKEKLNILTENEVAIAIISDNIFIPTIRLQINDNIVKLDSGAYDPIINGANVMAPGIYKYKSNLSYQNGEIVYIEIEGAIVAVGIATMDYVDIVETSRGVAVEIWMRKDDFVDGMKG